MNKEQISEQINSLADSMIALLRNAMSRKSKVNGFATIENYVAATRFQTEPMDWSRVELYSYAMNKLMETDSRLEFPPLHFTSTLDKNSSIVDIGAGPVLLVDLYQGQALEELGQLYLTRASPQECGAVALRLLAEHLVAIGKHELATHVAIHRHTLVNDGQFRKTAQIDKGDAETCGELQEVFVLAHEVGHMLWSRKQFPDTFIALASRWIISDAQAMAELHSRKGGAEENTDEFPNPYRPDQIQATVKRRCDPSGGFMEEVWADFFAWTSCMRLYFGNRPADEVYRDMTLALRNLAAIDAIRRLAERPADSETTDDASTRRQVLRLGLRTMFGDLRANDGFRQAIQAVESRVSEVDLNVDFAKIGVETEQRYMEVIWKPMMMFMGIALFSCADEKQTALQYRRCEEEFGAMPALQILRDNSITGESAKRLFASIRGSPVKRTVQN